VIHVRDLVVRSRRPKVTLGPVSFTLEAGRSHGLVGADADGAPLLLAVLAGTVGSRSGEVKVGGALPGARASIGYVPFVPDLPSALRVSELLGLSARVRGEKPASPEERLAVLGVETLARRRIGSLTLAEARAVALVEAVTSQATLLLLEEPLASLDPRAFAALAGALEDRVNSGATLVVSTASASDARELTAAQLYFDQGKLASQASRDEAWIRMTSGATRLVVRTEGARALLAALATDASFEDVSSHGPLLTLSGTDAVAMASAVARAALDAQVEIELMQFESAGDA
jgi:ABC-type multidrug transport system ATPase subunit